MMLKLTVALTLATVAAQDAAAAPRPWQEFMSQGLNVGIGGMNKGLTTGLAYTGDDPKPGTSEIVGDFTSFGAEGAQGFGNLASGLPVEGAAAAAGGAVVAAEGAAAMPKAAEDPAAAAAAAPAAAVEAAPAAAAAAVPPGTLEGFGGDKPFLDNAAFQPTNTKAHLGTEQEFLNAAALTSINFGNLAHKHGNLYGNGKGDNTATATEFSQEGVNTANRFILLSGPLGEAVSSAGSSPELQPSAITEEESQPASNDQSSWQFPGIPFGSAVAGGAAVSGLVAALAFRTKSKKDQGVKEDAVSRQPTGHEMV